MRSRERWVMWVVMGVLFFMSAGLSQAAEFSAKMVTEMHGKDIPGKIYLKGNKVRNETMVEGQTHVMIVRPDKKVVWMLMPRQKAYMEMPITDESQHQMMTMTGKDKPDMKLVGTETINGFECDKYETTVSHQGQSTKHYAWVAKKLGIPIKMTSADGSVAMEYQDIKPGPVADSLFEPPPGYRKMKMPVPAPSMK